MTKKLQIVRVDNDLVQKATLQIGNNIIGRGAATGCNDGQVLKHALTINLSPNDEMTITPVAPCYMKPAGSARWQSLQLGNSVPIKSGDVCSLLPDKCWFKIISMSDTMEENDQILKRKAEGDSSNQADSKKVCLSNTASSTEAVLSPSETLKDILDDKDLSTKYENSSINGNGDQDTTAPVLQEIYSASCPEGDMPARATSSKMSIGSQDVAEPSAERESNGKRKAENINLTSKAEANEPEKKIKWDCGAHFSDETERASGTQNDPQSPGAARKQKKAPKPDRVPREKCTYGSQCYRRNPNHKTNYSHPGDRDYDEVDDREECPYGAKCYRKNPQHKAQFKHTTAPRRRRRAATPLAVDNTSETDHSSAEESVDESDYEPSLYTDSSDDWDDSRSEWDDGTTG